RLWDLSGGAGQAKPAAGFASPSHYNPSGASWSPDGRRLALHIGYSGYVLDARSGAVLHEFPTSQWGMQLTFTPGGRLFRAIWTKGADHTGLLELLDGDDRRPFPSTPIIYRPHEIVAAHFPCPDDRHVYFAIEPGEVHRWAPQTGEVVHLFGQKTTITH